MDTKADNISKVCSSSGVVSLSNSPACAVCKYQRRRCAPGCLLAPYFPADRQKDFLNAHKLFGVSNLMKIIKRVKPSEREEAMRTVIYEANARAQYPVQGCYGMILCLEQENNFCKAELDQVLHQLSFYHSQSSKHETRNIHSVENIKGKGVIDIDIDSLSSVYDLSSKHEMWNLHSAENIKGKGAIDIDNDQMSSVYNPLSKHEMRNFHSVENIKGKCAIDNDIDRLSSVYDPLSKHEIRNLSCVGNIKGKGAIDIDNDGLSSVYDPSSEHEIRNIHSAENIKGTGAISIDIDGLSSVYNPIKAQSSEHIGQDVTKKLSAGDEIIHNVDMMVQALAEKSKDFKPRHKSRESIRCSFNNQVRPKKVDTMVSLHDSTNINHPRDDNFLEHQIGSTKLKKNKKRVNGSPRCALKDVNGTRHTDITA